MEILALSLPSVVGVIIIYMGLIMWKKEKIDLMHDYHYKQVAKEDIASYTKAQGINLMTIGIGTLAMGVLIYFDFILIGIVVFFILFINATIIFVKTQKKYNGNIF